MLNDLKKSLWPIIVIGISLLLIPTIVQLLHLDPDEDAWLYLILNSNLVQVLGILLAIFSGGVYLTILLKEKRSETILTEAGEIDPIWDEDSLKNQTRAAFYKVQGALRHHEIEPLRDYATPEFISWFQQVLSDKRESNIAATDIDITETRIICCADFLNNDKDRFVGYIRGNLVEDQNNEDSLKKEFSEMYHFVRARSGWLLNKIDGTNFWNLLSFSSKYQKY